MAEQAAKRELIIPIRTILIVSAAIGVLGAFVAIGDTFLSSSSGSSSGSSSSSRCGS